MGELSQLPTSTSDPKTWEVKGDTVHPNAVLDTWANCHSFRPDQGETKVSPREERREKGEERREKREERRGKREGRREKREEREERVKREERR